MGEEAVSLRFESDGSMDEKCRRIELKRSLDCVVDSNDSELEVPNKKLAVESSVESSDVVDSVEVEKTLHEKPENGNSVFENENASEVELECVLGNNEVEARSEESAVECLSDENDMEIEAKCGSECVVDSVAVDSVDEKCGNECILERNKVEAPGEQQPEMVFESRCQNECVDGVDMVDEKCRNERILERNKVDTQDEQPMEIDSSRNECSPEVESACQNECVDAVDGVDEKCRNECILETNKVETQDEQPLEISLSDQCSSKVESRCLNECVDAVDSVDEKCRNEYILETNTVETQDEQPLEIVSLCNECSSKVESMCQNECVDAVDSFDEKCRNECISETNKVVTQDEQPMEIVSLSNECSSKVESRCQNECVDAVDSVDEKCRNECILEKNKIETQDEQPMDMVFLNNGCSSKVEPIFQNECVDAMDSVGEKCRNECVLETNKIETQDEQPMEMVSLNNECSSKVESRCQDGCVLDTVEADAPLKQPEMESLYNENSSVEASKCLNEAEIPDRELEIESLNDENSRKAGSKCSKECVLDTVEAEIPDKEPVAEADDVSFSNPESKCLNENDFGNIEAETSDTKLATVSLVVENSSSGGHNSCKEDLVCLNECVFDASEAATHDSRTSMEFSTEEKNSRAALKRTQEWIVDATEVESPNKKPALRSSNYEISSEEESKRISGCLLDASNAESPYNSPANKVLNDKSSKTGLKCIHGCSVDIAGSDCLSDKPSIKSPDNKNSTTLEMKLNEGVDISIDTTEGVIPNNRLVKESLDNESASGVEPHEFAADLLESECVDNKPTIGTSTVDKSNRVEPNCLNECVLDATEVETPNNKPAKEFSDVGNSLSTEQRCLYECDIDAIEGETHEKSLTKELSTESVSEVLNPNVSPHENASSSQTVSSQPVEGILRSGCRDITSSNVGDSCAELADKEGPFVNGLPDSLSNSEVVLEGTKVPNAHGIRKIVFTFSKSKKCNDVVSASHPSCMDSDNGFCYSRRHGEPHMNYSKLSMTDILENYTKNVKKLLSTGILDGVGVKYINEKREILRGIIKDCGYLCGCDLCNFSKVLNGHEFEQHAGCKTKHPNDHVFLENGRSLYSIVQELKRSPVSSLEGTIRALVGPFFNEKSYFEWKESLEIGKFQTKEKECQMESHLNFVGFPQSTMSCSSEDTDDNLGSVSRSTMKKFPSKPKGSMLQSISKGGKQVTKSFRSASPGTTGGRTKKRDNDLHRLLFMPNGLPDGAELAYYAKGQRVLDGYKQGNGIVCSCCESEISPSQFEAHAGCAAKRQPYRHIFTSNGASLHDIAVSLANGQCLAISNSSEKCTICGDGGDLVVCDACAHGFHGACLELQCIPEEGWYCPYCKDKIGSGRKVASTEPVVSVKPITIRLTRIVKPPVAEVGGCVVCRIPDFSVLKFDERTVILCDQCEKEYHVGCLRKRGLCDLKELPQGKWFCCDSCNRIHATLQNLVFTKAKVIPTSMSNKINRKLIEKGFTCEVGNDVEWKVLSGKFGSLEHRSLLSSAVTLFRDSFDPIVERSGRDLIPAMVYGRNVSGQEFGGMYCAVLSVKSVVVSAGLLRIFGLEVAELPLVATAKESQGKGYFQVLFSCIEKLLRFLNVEKLVLPAAEDAKSIWTNKFGFKKMTDDQNLFDQFQRYTRDIQLISFKGTLMLEKTVLSQPK